MIHGERLKSIVNMRKHYRFYQFLSKFMGLQGIQRCVLKSYLRSHVNEFYSRAA